MKNSKISAKSLLNKISYKKYQKNESSKSFDVLKNSAGSLKISNLDIPNLIDTFEYPIPSKSSKESKKYEESKESKNPKKPEKSEKSNFSKKEYKKLIEYENLKNLLDNTSSCQISDAYYKIAKRTGVLKDLKSVNGKTAYGRVVTVKTSSDDWGTSLLGIDEAKKGNILFIKTNGSPSAIWGELTSSCSKKKELEGTVILGEVRDIDFLKEFDYPVFAKGTVPNAGTAIGLGKVNIPIEIGEITINPGDFIFADNSGVVHIPQELFSKVMVKALEIKDNEATILSQIEKGKSLSEIVGLK